MNNNIMTRLIPGHEEEFMKKKYERIFAEYEKSRIDINSLNTEEEIEEAKRHNEQLLRQLE